METSICVLTGNSNRPLAESICSILEIQIGSGEDLIAGIHERAVQIEYYRIVTVHVMNCIKGAIFQLRFSPYRRDFFLISRPLAGRSYGKRSFRHQASHSFLNFAISGLPRTLTSVL